MRKLVEIKPTLPLLVYTQKRLRKWEGFDGIRTEVADSKELYSEGDVLIVPHRVDGIGLGVLEGLASGMPVVTTEGSMWQEYPAIRRIEATRSERVLGRSVDWYEPDPAHLAAICEQLIGLEIETESTAARAWAEDRDWDRLGPVLLSGIQSVCASA
ncbi:MAG: glycosyltransferase [Solirubrobacterales bacterium]